MLVQEGDTIPTGCTSNLYLQTYIHQRHPVLLFQEYKKSSSSEHFKLFGIYVTCTYLHAHNLSVPV